MFNQNTINPFIDQVIYTIDSMFENKEIPQSIKDYLYLICTGMILNYGTTYSKDIYKAINNTRYIYGIKDLNKLLTKEEYHSLINRVTESTNAYTLSTVTRQDKELKINYTIIIAKNRNNKQQLLEYLTHELNHILTSLNNTFTHNNNSILFRYGLFKTDITSTKKDSGRIFNEVINTLETEDIINKLLSLRKYKIYNNKFNEAFKILDSIQEEYTATGYEPFVNLYRPLFNKKEIKKLINKTMLEGSTDQIEELINKKLNNNSSYSEMISQLDELYINYEITKRNGLEKAYETSSQYLDFKNNIIYVLIDYKPDLA